MNTGDKKAKGAKNMKSKKYEKYCCISISVKISSKINLLFAFGSASRACCLLKSIAICNHLFD